MPPKTQPGLRMIQIRNQEDVDAIDLRRRAAEFRSIAETTRQINEKAISKFMGTEASKGVYKEASKPITDTLQELLSPTGAFMTVLKASQPVSQSYTVPTAPSPARSRSSSASSAAAIPLPTTPSERSRASTVGSDAGPSTPPTVRRQDDPRTPEFQTPTSEESDTVYSPFQADRFDMKEHGGFGAGALSVDRRTATLNNAPIKSGYMVDGRRVITVGDAQVEDTDGVRLLLTSAKPRMDQVTEDDIDSYLRLIEASGYDINKSRNAAKYKLIMGWTGSSAASSKVASTPDRRVPSSSAASTPAGRVPTGRPQEGQGAMKLTLSPQRMRPVPSQAQRVRPSGRFGSMVVDKAALEGQGLLRLTNPKTGEKVLERQVSPGLKHLLLHRPTLVSAGKKYTKQDVAQYDEVARLAKVPKPAATTTRAKLGKLPETIFVDGSPEKLQDRLEVLVRSRMAGNASQAAVNEAMAIADRLLRERHLTKAKHKLIFNTLLGVE